MTAQEEEREQYEASPINRITFVKIGHDRAAQIGLVALLREQILLPLSLLTPVSLSLVMGSIEKVAGNLQNTCPS